MPTTVTKHTTPAARFVLGMILTATLTLSASVNAQQQPAPAPGAPGYTRVQGQDTGAPPLPAVSGLRALIDHREEMRKLIQGIPITAGNRKTASWFWPAMPKN